MGNDFVDFDMINDFDEHILQSIPNYDILFNSIQRLSEYFVQDDKHIYDIGCSTGKLLKALSSIHKGKMTGIDYSKNLLPANTEQYENITFVEADLNKKYTFNNACLIFAIFTLQFLKKESRYRLLKEMWKGLCDGGAMIIAEKVYHEDGIFQDMFTFSYYDYKRTSFTEKQILDKEQSLRRILKPNTDYENIGMLEQIGQHNMEISTFYQYFNFKAYLCIKRV